jgi:hypothetical protein
MEYAGEGMKCAGKDIEKAGRGGEGGLLREQSCDWYL